MCPSLTCADKMSLNSIRGKIRLNRLKMENDAITINEFAL